jgi:PEGA domain
MITSYKNGMCAMVLAAAMASTGCGTMFGGSRQLIQAASIPEGATVAAAGTAGSRTPTSLSLERKNNYVLEFSAPGYTTQRVDVQKSLRGGIVVLDILGGVLPVIVDAITGGWYKLSPEQVNAMLTKVDAATPGPDTIGVTLNLDGAGRRDKAEVAIVSTVPGVAVTVRTQ